MAKFQGDCIYMQIYAVSFEICLKSNYIWNAESIYPPFFSMYMLSLNSIGNCTDVTGNSEGSSIFFFLTYFKKEITWDVLEIAIF